MDAWRAHRHHGGRRGACGTGGLLFLAATSVLAPKRTGQGHMAAMATRGRSGWRVSAHMALPFPVAKAGSGKDRSALVLWRSAAGRARLLVPLTSGTAC